MPARAVKTIQYTDETMSKTAAAIETADISELPRAATDAIRIMEISESEIDGILNLDQGSNDDPPLPFRELRGLDKALQTVRSELVLNLSKLSALDEHIALEERKLEEVRDDIEATERITERLRSLRDEREARSEAASACREDLLTEISRIRETIPRVLHEETTFGVQRAGRHDSKHPHSSRHDYKDHSSSFHWWCLPLKHLKALASLLAKYAGKAATALPGLIGSVVSYLLSMLSKTAGWLAENAWALIVAIAGLLLFSAREFLKPKRE